MPATFMIEFRQPNSVQDKISNMKNNIEIKEEKVFFTGSDDADLTNWNKRNLSLK